MSSNPIHNIAAMVTQAIDEQASAIEMELQGDWMRVYYIKEGVRSQHLEMPGHIFRPVATRYKLWSDVDLLNRRYPLKGQFSLIRRHRHYSADVVWEGPWPESSLTMNLVAGEEAEVEDDDDHFL